MTRVVNRVNPVPLSGGQVWVQEAGLDFSDSVECWWIFELGPDVDTIPEFWERFVVNS